MMEDPEERREPESLFKEIMSGYTVLMEWKKYYH